MIFDEEDDESWDDFDMGHERDMKEKKSRNDSFDIGGTDDEYDDEWEEREPWAI